MNRKTPMETKKLNHGDKHLLRLCLQGKQADGWAPVSEVVYPLLAKLPPSLITLEKLTTGGRAKLTDEGEAIVLYTSAPMSKHSKKFKFRPRKSIDGPGTVTNGTRAIWAEQALKVFREDKYPETDRINEPIHDLICDLLHLADREGIDTDHLIVSATSMWRDERE